MKDRLTDHDFENISALIRGEEEEALAIFRTGNFRDRLKSRLEEAAADEKPGTSFSRTAVPALAAALILVAAGAFLFIVKRPTSGPISEFRAIASALGQLPGLSHPPRGEWKVPLGQIEPSRLAETVGLVLVSAEKIKREEERKISPPAGTNKIPSLSFDQKMEILFKERVVERALLLFKGDFKEV